VDEWMRNLGRSGLGSRGVGESVTLHPDIAWLERQPDFRHTPRRKDGRREEGRDRREEVRW